MPIPENIVYGAVLRFEPSPSDQHGSPAFGTTLIKAFGIAFEFSDADRTYPQTAMDGFSLSFELSPGERVYPESTSIKGFNLQFEHSPLYAEEVYLTRGG